MNGTPLLRVLVGASRVPSDTPAPTLIVEAEPSRLEELRQQLGRDNTQGSNPVQFREAVLADDPQGEVCWFCYSDSRLNGVVPLQRWHLFYPNLQLEKEEICTTSTLAQILSEWPAATDGKQGISLTLSQGDPIRVLEGAKDWLDRIHRIELQGPKADALWLKSCNSWLQDRGYRPDCDSAGSWVIDPQASQLISHQAEVNALRQVLAAAAAEHHQDLENCQSSQARVLEALHQCFPHALYRKKRPDLEGFNDQRLVEHFIDHGIHEGVDLDLGEALRESEQLRAELAEANAQLSLLATKHHPLVKVPRENGPVYRIPVISETKGTGISAWLVGDYLYTTIPQSHETIAQPQVHKGSQVYPLRQTTWNNETARRLCPSQKLELLSDENQNKLTISTDEEAPQAVESGISQLLEWCVAGGETLHIELPEPGKKFSVGVVQSLEFEVARTESWDFEALLATHRARGSLEIIIKQNGSTKTYSIDFDSNRTGGINAKGYLPAKLEMLLEEGRCELSLNIKHEDFISDGNEAASDAYYFIANPQFRPTVYTEQPVPRQLQNLGATGTEETIYFGRVNLFACPEDSSLVLSLGNGTFYELFTPISNGISLREDNSHTLVMRAATPGRFSLFVNGVFAGLLSIQSKDTPVRLPVQWLRGEPVMVEIRDLSGSQVFLKHPVLAPRHLTSPELLLQESKPPFPTDLTVRANHRYQALRQHLQLPIEGLRREVLLRALETLDRNYQTLKLAPLEFPLVEQPCVSVVVPAHNKVEVTYYCLCALLLAHNRNSFEVILVDDGSTDETAEIEAFVNGITVIHNEEPLRFIKACNRGVREARGKYVVLLNNDTEVTVGWLDALVDAFHRFEGVGAVGAKLLYPDGSLQDAGGIIWGSGNPGNYGNGQNPWDPRFSYTRQVDYLSGAALMTTKGIWDEVGGLSHYLEPMYFEDTDFSFKVRDAGYKTYFVPSSVVYHFEGTTSGTDTSKGFKAYQELNRPKFKRRWAKAFAQHGKEGIQPDLEKDRGLAGRILFIDYATPREDRDAGSYAALREIELVQSLGYKVTFLPQNLENLGEYTEELQRKGVEVITTPFYLSLAAFIAERGKEFDAAYITRYYVAADTVSLIREHSPKTRLILNNADLHFLRELRAALSENDEARMEIMRDIREQELAMMRSVDLVLSYNEVEHVVIISHTDGEVKVMTCPWVVEIPADVTPLEDRTGLSFLGSFQHHPNNEGVAWFCREVMPQLEAQELKLSIYGSGMGDDITGLASNWIDPVGFIADVADAYQRHRVFVAPLLSGAGMKGKVVNALAYGIPTVLSPTAAEGIGLRHGHDCLIAKNSEEWVEAITRLSHDDDLWSAISSAARSYAASQFSFSAGREKMKAALESVDLFSHIVD
ncbi:glycosyltransferase [Cyanobium sp. ATX 6A2]|uniref:glycosyltransferase n=1 Tax=Cyanobium sp. ATX 6A2 TaxID=2823700 RepID=UPI0020CC16F6|nr:glycosyltransferase [Cyanobium sp. ATX 6A2]MCP9889363.1 glycosyltransferase [Cyanobium sp. ATX 6A2]